MLQTSKTIADVKKIAFYSQFTDAQIREQLRSNIETFESMKSKAIETGKKQGGMTVEQLQDSIDRYTAIVNS